MSCFCLLYTSRIKAENEAYKALARIQDSNTEASYISAFVIGRDPLDEFGGFTLDCGTVNGAAVNDAVTVSYTHLRPAGDKTPKRYRERYRFPAKIRRSLPAAGRKG